MWISKRAQPDHKVKRTKIFDLKGPTVHILLVMPDSLSFIWGHSVHFAKFPILQFSKCYCTSPTIFIGSHPSKLYEYENILLLNYHGGMQAIIFFLAIGQVLQNLWHFEILTLPVSQRENLKCGISQKRLIIERRENYGTFFLHTLQCIYYLWCPIPWVSFGVIQCTLQNFRFYNFQNATVHLQQFSSDLIHPNFMSMRTYCCLITMGECRLLYSSWQSDKFYKIYGILKF